MEYLKPALIAQLILAFYFQLILWFPLGAWNDQPGNRLITVVKSGEAPLAAITFASLMLLPGLLFALAYWRRWLWLIWLCLCGNIVWLAMQVQSWWIPYIFGANARAIQNQRFLSRTYKILPSSPNHPAPDAMHMVLDILLSLVVARTLIGLLKARRQTILHQSAASFVQSAD